MKKKLNKLLCRLFGHKYTHVGLVNGYLICNCDRCDYTKFERFNVRSHVMEINQ